jgi:hypothetical protein
MADKRKMKTMPKGVLINCVTAGELEMGIIKYRTNTTNKTYSNGDWNFHEGGILGSFIVFVFVFYDDATQ